MRHPPHAHPQVAGLENQRLGVQGPGGGDQHLVGDAAVGPCHAGVVAHGQAAAGPPCGLAGLDPAHPATRRRQGGVEQLRRLAEQHRQRRQGDVVEPGEQLVLDHIGDTGSHHGPRVRRRGEAPMSGR